VLVVTQGPARQRAEWGSAVPTVPGGWSSPSHVVPSTASMQRSASSGRWYVTYALPEGPALACAWPKGGVVRLTDTCMRACVW
jgi:hypothetical protein